jgi:hypothetical protein
MHQILRIALLTLTIAISGCMTVPQEVVQLSTLTTTDVKALHDGYRSLVRKHFASLRKNREQEFADKILGPYVEDAIKEGRLLDVIQGKVVWNNDKEEFIAPDPARASAQKLDTLSTWNRQVAADIEGLRKDAFSDLEALEGQVLDEVDRAFGNVIRGSSTIHGYLLSLQKVENTQNEFLKGIGFGELPKKLNDALDHASTEASKWSARTSEADKKGKNVLEQIKKTKGN